jgi:hypothetical protein
MSKADLIKRTTIKFKNPLTRGELETILFKVAEKEGCRVNYDSIISINYDPSLELRNRRREDPQRTSGSFNPSGTRENNFVSVSFNLNVDYVNDENKYTQLTFFTAPGYDENELPKSELEFMDKVRRYFEVKE